LASKVCGAGGGGCLITCCQPEKRGQVEEALEGAGATVLKYSIAREGIRITEF